MIVPSFDVTLSMCRSSPFRARRIRICPRSILSINSANGGSLVQKRQLLRRLFIRDLRGRLADEMAQRAGEMRLIEIARLKDRVEDGRSLPQENRRVAGALDLADGAMRQPGRAQKTPLC